MWNKYDLKCKCILFFRKLRTTSKSTKFSRPEVRWASGKGWIRSALAHFRHAVSCEGKDCVGVVANRGVNGIGVVLWNVNAGTETNSLRSNPLVSLPVSFLCTVTIRTIPFPSLRPLQRSGCSRETRLIWLNAELILLNIFFTPSVR